MNGLLAALGVASMNQDAPVMVRLKEIGFIRFINERSADLFYPFYLHIYGRKAAHRPTVYSIHLGYLITKYTDEKISLFRSFSFDYARLVIYWACAHHPANIYICIIFS